MAAKIFGTAVKNSICSPLEGILKRRRTKCRVNNDITTSGMNLEPSSAHSRAIAKK
jgi:hypothetical protein